MTPARRGDLVALVRTVHTTAADYSRTTTEQVSLARVTSVTRDGIVKAAAAPDNAHAYRKAYDDQLGTRVVVAPASVVDVDAALQAYATRRYQTAPQSSMVPPFDSLREARAFLTNFRTHTTEV